MVTGAASARVSVIVPVCPVQPTLARIRQGGGSGPGRASHGQEAQNTVAITEKFVAVALRPTTFTWNGVTLFGAMLMTCAGVSAQPAPPVARLPEGQDAVAVAVAWPPLASCCLTIARSKTAVGFTQTVYEVTLQVPLNPVRSSWPAAVVRLEIVPPSPRVSRST